MKGKVIVPVNEVEEDPVIFLAGPVVGAPFWHNEAIKVIRRMSKKPHIASPSRELNQRYLNSNVHTIKSCKKEPGSWPEIDWQMRYLKKAFEGGCQLFWMPKEKIHYPEYPYAQGSRYELGEWSQKAETSERLSIIVGFEQDFPGREFLTYKLSRTCPSIPITNNLEEACEIAVALAGCSKSKDYSP